MAKLIDTPRGTAVSLMERRRYERLPLRLPVRLSRSGVMVSAGVTENVSSQGFYCVSPDPFVLGDRLQAVLLLPAHNLNQSEMRVCLTCQAHVVRLDSTWLGPGFGIGCRIETYSLSLERIES
jgi:hypothetical protein